MSGDKYSHLPIAPAPPAGPPGRLRHELDGYSFDDDAAFDAEVDRDPYQGRRPGRERNFARGMWIGIAIILVATIVILGVTLIVLR